MQNIVVAYALEEEKVNLQKKGCTFHYIKTSVGKVNAAIAIQQAIYKYKPDAVLNIGTAGSVHHPVGSIHTCHTFIDRDMEKLVEFGLTCKEDFRHEIKNHSLFGGWHFNAVCNSGDTFLTSKDGTGDIFDMEAFAIARVCKAMNLPLAAIKYVTDVIGENSVKQWEEKLSEAQQALQAHVNNI